MSSLFGSLVNCIFVYFCIFLCVYYANRKEMRKSLAIFLENLMTFLWATRAAINLKPCLCFHLKFHLVLVNNNTDVSSHERHKYFYFLSKNNTWGLDHHRTKDSIFGCQQHRAQLFHLSNVKLSSAAVQGCSRIFMHFEEIGANEKQKLLVGQLICFHWKRLSKSLMKMIEAWSDNQRIQIWNLIDDTLQLRCDFKLCNQISRIFTYSRLVEMLTKSLISLN